MILAFHYIRYTFYNTNREWNMIHQIWEKNAKLLILKACGTRTRRNFKNLPRFPAKKFQNVNVEDYNRHDVKASQTTTQLVEFDFSLL